jgi:hypothetical protein
MKTIPPHEPTEELLTAAEAFADADESERRWQSFDADCGVKRVVLDLPAALYQGVERVAKRQGRSVPAAIRWAIQDSLARAASSG